MKVFILGSGGREHALARALLEADRGARAYVCPGNAGTSGRVRTGSAEGDPSARMENVPGTPHDPAAMVRLARELGVDLTIVGPEAPLVTGVADQFSAAGLPLFGPTAAAARLEGSKAFSKTLLSECGVATAAFEVFDSPAEARTAARVGAFPKVIKCDGLAAGKGVFIVRNAAEAEAAVAEILEEGRFGSSGNRLVLEEFLEGEEVSAFAMVRDEEFRLLPLSQDHKRIRDGDQGPNTGGMGAYAPFVGSSPEFLGRIEDEVFRPVLRAMAARGTPYRGLLYAGLILAGGRPQVLEFNCRFGDPEAQAVLPLIETGLYESMRYVATGEGDFPSCALRRASAATVVLASAGYPGTYEAGKPISGLEAAAELPETFVYHAGTRLEGDQVVTAGGRVLSVTGRGESLEDAIARAYAACDAITFEGKTMRHDIGRKGLVASA